MNAKKQEEEHEVQQNFSIYRDKGQKAALMDRGHMFFHPGRFPPPQDLLQPAVHPQTDGSVSNDVTITRVDEDDEDSHRGWVHPTHPPLPTHSPDLTNQPWWTTLRWQTPTTKKPHQPWWTTRKPSRRVTTTLRTTRTTRRPFAWEVTTPTTAPTTTGWWNTPPTTKSWYTTAVPARRPMTTERTTTTILPSTNEDYCSPPYFKDASSTNLIYQNTSERITGGSKVIPHSFPWIAVLFQGHKHVCGGSLVSDVHVLTAAHCVAGLSSWQMREMRVVLGVHNLRGSEGSKQEFTIKTVIKHKDYSRRLLYNDVAILTLSEPVRVTGEVRPICLYTGKEDFVDTYAKVVGWGSLFEGGIQLDTPRQVDLRIWSNDECRSAYGRGAPGGIVESYLCAGRQGKDACSGDSGGPIVKQMNGVWQQIGIVSWGIGCGKGHYPGVYSRISTFLPWIRKVKDKF